MNLISNAQLMMRKKIGTFFLLLFFIYPLPVIAAASPHFVVVIPSYNNEKWITKNLESVLSQTYMDWSIIYVDDCSTDQTNALAAQFIKAHQLQNRCTLIRNKARRLGLANIYDAIHSCQPRDVIVLLDGDDWLAHDKVFEKLARIYSTKDVWLTYGNFRSDPPGWVSCCSWIPLHIRRSNTFRKYNWVSSHLRTFYAKLFCMIHKEDLQMNGQFLSMTHDMAIMFPMLEMAAERRFFFVKEVLYVYNVANPLMDCLVNAQLQRDLDKYVRSLPPYQPLSSLF